MYSSLENQREQSFIFVPFHQEIKPLYLRQKNMAPAWKQFIFLLGSDMSDKTPLLYTQGQITEDWLVVMSVLGSENRIHGTAVFQE